MGTLLGVHPIVPWGMSFSWPQGSRWKLLKSPGSLTKKHHSTKATYEFMRVSELLGNGWYRWVLVGGWTNPSEKYARQIGSFPQIGMKKKCLKPPPRVYLEILSRLLPFAHLFTHLWTMLQFSSVWETLTQFSGLTKKGQTIKELKWCEQKLI